MTIQTQEQLMKAFETLADEKHHPSVFRASERIRQHLASVPETLAATLATDDLPHCYCEGVDCKAGPEDAVCPVAKEIFQDLIPVLLRRIGA